MSPLKIKTLLNLHVMAHPFDDMRMAQVYAPAMVDAFQFFEHHGLLAPGVSHNSVVSEPIKRAGSISAPRLSEKGRALAARLCEVEPGEATRNHMLTKDEFELAFRRAREGNGENCDAWDVAKNWTGYQQDPTQYNWLTPQQGETT